MATNDVQLYRCPCCGDDVMDTGPVCGDCRAADCAQTRDACGEVNWWDCQRPDDDDAQPATPDDVITLVTEAATPAAARAIVRATPPRLLGQVADLLYIDADHHSAPWLRVQIIREARS